MAQIHLLPIHECLLNKLAATLLERDQAALAEIRILCPTARLGTWLRALLAQKLGALFPPKIQSFETWMKDTLGPELYPPALAATSVDMLLLEIMRHQSYTQLRPGHERELRLLYNEIYGQSLGLKVYESLRESLGSEALRDPLAYAPTFAKLGEIEALGNALRSLLKTRGFYLGGEAESLKAQLMLETLPKLANQELWLCGFTSLNGSLIKVWQALTKRDKTQIFITAPLRKGEGGINELLKELPLGDLVPESKPYRDAKVVVLKDRFEEIAFGLRQLSDWIQEGLSPSALGVVVGDEGAYAPMLRDALKRSALKGNFALGLSLQNTAPALWLRALVTMIKEPYQARALSLWLLDPLSISLLGQKIPSSDYQDLAALIYWSLEKKGQRGLQPWLKEDFTQVPLATELQVGLRSILALFKPYQDLDPADWLSEFSQLLGVVLDLSPPSPEQDSIADAFQDLLNSMAELIGFLGVQKSGLALLEMFLKRMESTELHSIGEPMHGIQVLSLAESRHVPFQAIVFLGLNEGSCPQGLPRDALLDDILKQRSGLPGWQGLETLEEYHFKLLLARVPRVILTLAKSQLGQDLAPSRFISELCAYNPDLRRENPEDFSLSFSPPRLEPVLKPSTEPPSPLGSFVGPLDSWIEPLSASHLRTLLRCPYAALMKQLNLEPSSLSLEDDHPLLEGAWLHKVIESFFLGLGPRQKALEWPEFHCEDEAFIAWALGRLMDLSEDLGPYKLREDALWWHLKLYAWPRLLAHVQKIYAGAPVSKLAQSDRELSLNGIQIRLKNSDRPIRGQCDAVEKRGHLYILTDYKRNHPPQAAQLRHGLDPQLSLYALAFMKLRATTEPLVAGYWSFLKGEWTPVGVNRSGLALAEALGLAHAKTPLIDELWQNFESKFCEVYENIEAEGRFFLNDQDCGLCSHEGLCLKSRSKTSWPRVIEA